MYWGISYKCSVSKASAVFFRFVGQFCRLEKGKKNMYVQIFNTQNYIPAFENPRVYSYKIYSCKKKRVY